MEPPQEKQILYILIAEKKKILCDFYKRKGNFVGFTETILKEFQAGKSVLVYKE